MRRGEIYLSDTLADEARAVFGLDLTFLGQHDLLEDWEKIAVYSTGDIDWKTRLIFMADSGCPGGDRSNGWQAQRQ